MKAKKTFNGFAALVLIATLIGAAPVAAATETGSALPAFQAQSGNFSEPAAFDVSPALSELASTATSARSAAAALASEDVLEIRPDRGTIPQDKGFSGDEAMQGEAMPAESQQLDSQSQDRGFSKQPLTISPPIVNFEGLSNQDNFNVFGGRVNPPDPVGDVKKSLRGNGQSCLRCLFEDGHPAARTR
jgi:hypothetical protein